MGNINTGMLARRVLALDLSVNHISSLAHGWFAAFPLLRSVSFHHVRLGSEGRCTSRSMPAAIRVCHASVYLASSCSYMCRACSYSYMSPCI
jgi:hypothetical protein